MNTINSKRAQLSVIAVAALAFLAVAAVLLLGGGPAQADTATPNIGGSPLPPQQQAHPTPEACAEEPVHVISSGHYAIFDVYWDAEDKNLVNNPCPPALTLETHQETNSDGVPIGTPTYSISRAASKINIDSTVFHVPGAADLTPRANNDADYAKWPFLYPDAADGDDEDNTIEGSEIGDPISVNVWTLPECSHDTTSAPSDTDICIGFSAGLLQAGDWKALDYEFESIREPGIAADDRGHAFVFYGDTDDIPDRGERAIWNTSDADRNEISITGGEYVHRQWAFSAPGTYRFEVHVKGRPLPNFFPAKTVTSVVRTYTFHVGDLSDLGVAITASEPAPEVGAEVTYTVTASNAGPDPADAVAVTVTLPPGLTYGSSEAATGTYDAATGVWSVGDLAVEGSTTLTITATTGSDTHGKPLTVTANIKATETIGSSVVDELDPREGDNAAEATVTPQSRPNVEPVFQARRSVPENSAAGTSVGGPVWVSHTSTGDTLTYGLRGNGSHKFAVAAVDGGAQVNVAAGAALDYEIKPTYDLLLTVSDGNDRDGNNNGGSVDDTIAVRVTVTDVDETDVVAESLDSDGAGIALTADRTRLNVGESVTLTVAVGDLPEGYSLGAFAWQEATRWSETATFWDHDPVIGGANPHRSYALTEPGVRRFRVIAAYGGEGTGGLNSTSGFVEVEWVNP